MNCSQYKADEAKASCTVAGQYSARVCTIAGQYKADRDREASPLYNMLLGQHVL